ncbi:MAG: RimK domain-containing protein ATP-grasp [Actinobacteria bacterium]|nr:RimK domain-containing protein ATP-grasp [Actinomycetota bacterium]
MLNVLWGIAEDDSLTAVRRALERRHARYFFLDQRMLLNCEVETSVDDTVRGLVRIRDQVCDLAEVKSVYLRNYALALLTEFRQVGGTGIAWQRTQAVDDALRSWVEVTPALAINRFSAMAAAESKPYQSRLIRSAGFYTPATLITTDAEAAHEFWKRNGTVVYKSISGTRSIVSRLGSGHADRFTDIRWCPTQFQQYIAGRDFRVHVVGAEAFACQIDSNADDYRYAARNGGSVRLSPCRLPQDCTDRCVALATQFGFTVAGVDLRQTRQGQWYCFEINGSPTFTYYEAPTSQAVADAIANLMVAAAPT